MTTGLTRSAEDYLLTIYRLHSEKHTARVKDVAEVLGVKKPSVVTQVHRLKDEGLVEQSPYGRIELTERGRRLARGMFQKNRRIFAFLHHVLGVCTEVADEDACGIEHHLHPETMQRFLAFTEDLHLPLGDLDDDGVEVANATINDLDIGTCAEIFRLVGDDGVRARLLAQGFVPGERVRLVNVAPLGDPLDVFVQGTHLTLHREEADCVLLRRESIRPVGANPHCQNHGSEPLKAP
jgi:DtxR family Mn-dependent transcriptional regulator